jgi:beta-lactamase class A
MISPEHAYRFALEQEQRGNYQAAFETLFDIERYFPGYLDVTRRLIVYRQRNFFYTSKQSFFKNNPDLNIVSSLPAVPAPVKATGNRKGLVIALIGLGVAAIIAAAITITLLLLNNSNSRVGQSNVSINPVAASPTLSDITTPVVNPAEPSPTPEITTTNVAPVTTPSPTSATTTPTENDGLDGIRIVLNSLPADASAFIILPDGRSIGVNETTDVTSAQMLKLWVAAAVYDEVVNARINLYDTYILKEEDRVPGTGFMSNPEWVGTKFTYEDILYNMLVHSDNTAANILLSLLGSYDRVNTYAKNNGYEQTTIFHKFGYTLPGVKNYTSARDVALFFDGLKEGTVVTHDISDDLLNILSARIDEGDNAEDGGLNLFRKALPGDVMYVHFSGVDKKIRHEVGMFEDHNGNPVIISILLGNADDENKAEDTITRFIKDIWQLTSTMP